VPRTQVSLFQKSNEGHSPMTSMFWSWTQFFIPMKNSFCFMVVL
jgi:hypothetical protein